MIVLPFGRGKSRGIFGVDPIFGEAMPTLKYLHILNTLHAIDATAR